MITLSNYQFQKLQSYLEDVQLRVDSINSIFQEAKRQSNHLTVDASNRFPSRPMTKSEIAGLLGISTRQLSYWLQPFRSQLREMGASDRARLLQPQVVFFICNALHITLDEQK